MKNKSSEKRRHVVAWVNKAEWDQVLEYLYSQDPSLQLTALHRISAWKARYAGGMPVAVDCTADLVRCQVLDRPGQMSGDDLVLLYGSALVRFVNLITERQQGKVAQPPERLAGNLNIPEWVVDLRHDFTHRKLPTLKWCRKGCKVVLEWLQQEYWSRQMGGGPDEDWDSQSLMERMRRTSLRQQDELVAQQKEMEAYKNARELLISYEKDQYEAFSALPEDKTRSFCPSPFADMSWLLGEIKQFSLEYSSLLIDVLLEEGFLIPTMEQLDTLGCNTSENADPAQPRLPQTFLRFWLPLLKVLNSPSFIHLLLEKLFAELKLLTGEQNANHRFFYVSAWTSEVLLCNSNKFEYHFETKMQKKARVRDRIFVNRIQLRWQQLLSACLDAPCVSTPHLLQLILDDMEHPLPLETLGAAAAALLPSTRRLSAPDSSHGSQQKQQQQPIYTLESLHEKLQHSRISSRPQRSQSSQEHKVADVQAEAAKALRGSPWQVCSDDTSWKNYPLGKVPGQSDDPSCLMLKNYSPMTVFDQPVELEKDAAPSSLRVSTPARTPEGLLWNLET
ncbi:LOW QUALITY PROTEIN: ribosomal biogenesis protein LAS1L [Salarias fasciatus]|uniref:LOW QUALITY PROTEIN: ribosomal biogenesis protein LAS1L n=1 Tax=Salarias fasciatus TaxID=181472 RepID=UPI001176E243|nr:LOW QUALITY PROTEIN: ribosomal biogenesis protein LAS1L [Salarias fasciatus]